MDQKSNELKWEGHFISSQEELYVFVLKKKKTFACHQMQKPKQCPWTHVSAQSCWPRGLSWLTEVKSKSMCLGQNSSARDDIHVSAGIKWESPNFTCSWPSPSLQCLSYRLVTLYCLEMIMIKFHLTISSFNCCGHLEIWMQKIEIGLLLYTK